MMEGRLFVGIRKGRPHLRWMDNAVADLRAMRIKQWMQTMQDTEKWRRIVEEGCRAKRKEGSFLIWIQMQQI